ncbi:MAG: hypothetical protein ABL931_17140 [Usitatibacteraceae bacterium]
MKKVFAFASIVLALAPAVSAAQSVFDGTWKTDVKTIDFPAKPVIYVFKDGMYECKTCATKYLVKADGKDQKVEGDPYLDTLSVKIVDKNHVEMVGKKGGKVMSRDKFAVSTDGNSMQREYANSSAVNAEVIKGVTSYARTAYDKTAPSQMSGSWKPQKAEKVSDNGLLVTYKSEGATMNMSTPTGESYSAKTDGTDAPLKGDPGANTVSVKVKKNTLEETYKRDGKVVGSTRMEVDAGGKKAKVDWIDNLTRTNGNYSTMKQ